MTTLHAWLRHHEPWFVPSDIALALAALKAVESEHSEVAALWAEAGADEWKANIASLRARLGRLT